MNSSDLINNFLNNLGKIKGILIILALFMLISPFSGDFNYFSRLISNLKLNWNGFVNLSGFNPINFSISAFMLQIEYFIEYIFPRFWGYDNLFFIRILLKFPSLILFIISSFVIAKLIKIVYKIRESEEFFFYIHLFNLPILYSVIVQGTNEIFPITFFFISRAAV